MDNYRSSGMHYQNQGTNTTNNGGKNRNRKKKNKQNKNQNLPLSPSKSIINHYDDYGGSMSLDHQSFGRPFSQFPNNQNYAYNNRAKYNNNGKFNKRRNGSQSNYYSSGTYENDRLNKSLTPNSSFGENQRIQTSISLDNFDLVSSLNAKRSPSSSYPLMSSNVVIGQKPSSPFKNGTYQQQQTIVEQVNLEEMSETTASLSMHDVEAKSNDVLSSITSTESLNTSGDFMVDHHTPLSNYSTPMNHSDSSRVFDPDMSPKKHRDHEESLNQNDKTPIRYDEAEHTVKHSEAKSDHSSALSSNSSPDSKNSDQNLVTASEGENSFTSEQLMPNHQEHNLAKELEKIAANFELNVLTNQDTESNKSVNGSADSSATESYATTSNERDDEMKDSEQQSNSELDNAENKVEQLVIQKVRLELDEDKKEETVIEEKIDEPLVVQDQNRVSEQTSDHAIEDLSLEEKKEQTVLEVEEAMSEQQHLQAIETKSSEEDKIENTTQKSQEIKEEEPLEQSREESAEMKQEIMKEEEPLEQNREESAEIMKKEEEPLEQSREESAEIMKKEEEPLEQNREESAEMKQEIMNEKEPLEQNREESAEMIKAEGLVKEGKQEDREQNKEAMNEKDVEEKVVDLCEVKVESVQLAVGAQSVDTRNEENKEIIVGTGGYEIQIRPHVEEIILTDGEQVIKQGSDLKIAPVETGSNEEARCDEDHQEFEILEQSNDSIVSEPNDKTNTSITQKEPAVDCFSCTIV